MIKRFLTNSISALAGLSLLATTGTIAIPNESNHESKASKNIEYLHKFGKEFTKGKQDSRFLTYLVILNDNDYEEVKKMDSFKEEVSDGFLESAWVVFSDSTIMVTYAPRPNLDVGFADYFPYGLNFNSRDYVEVIKKQGNEKVVGLFSNGKISSKRYVGNAVDGEKESELEQKYIDLARNDWDSVLDQLVEVIKRRYGDKYNIK